MEDKNKSLKEKLLNYEIKPSGARNIMGCSEDWYDPFYAVSQTFSKEELNQMTEKEIENLIRLADNIAEYLY